MTHVLHRNLRIDPEFAASGEGLILTLADGRRVIDAAGGAAVACLGHGNPRVVAAIAAQARRSTTRTPCSSPPTRRSSWPTRSWATSPAG